MKDSNITMEPGIRDYYEELFSPDTDPATSSTSDQLENSVSSNEDGSFILSGISLVEHHNNKIETGNSTSVPTSSSFLLHRSNLKCDKYTSSGSDMDISSESESESDSESNSNMSFGSSSTVTSELSSTSSAIESYDQDNEEKEKEKEKEDISQQELHSTLEPVINFLDDEDVEYLLGENIPFPKTEYKETLEKDNVDIIASFNVRNKYDHITAAELLIKEKLTFLSIQEPYASSHKASESWKAFQKLELESARISCFETPYQMILFDSWKWGGRVISPFQSLQYGRIASIGFDLGNDLQIGIVSVYAPSKDSKNVHYSEEPTHPTMRITNTLVQKILSKWKTLFPKMVTLVMGDLQETVTTLDKDNLGTYRQDPTPHGIVTGMSMSHESIVRKKNPNTPYVTRFGDEGARGIDHIFFPSDEKLQNVCVDAKIQRDVGASYFPSDHSLITCSISRSSQNNNCSGVDKTKYDYNKLFSIKLNQKGSVGEDFDFDFSQFKNCQKYRDQLELYQKIQKLTSNDSKLTNAYLGDLETRADNLFQNLWENGIIQKTHGPTNKLVQISEANAAELSFILNQYNGAIKAVMEELKFDRDHNNNDSAGKTRGRLRTRKGFKQFNNLPVPTKLRYLKVQVDAKSKEISKNLYWLKEFHIRKTYGTEGNLLPQDQFWNQWNAILKDDNLKKRAKDVSIAYNEEEAERSAHSTAIDYKENVQKGRKSRECNTEVGPDDGNILPHVSDNVTRLLNFWLSSSGCNQGFSTSSSPSTSPENSSAFLSHRITDWKMHLTSQDVNEFDLTQDHQAKLIQSCLENALVDVQKLNNQITRLQTFYRQSTLTYFLDTKNISSFTSKVSFKSKQAPAAHTSIWDPELKDFRTCRNELEELTATSAFHGKWMANSASKEVCAFAKIIRDGRLGNRGIKLNPDRRITLKDIPNLIHNGNSLPRRVKKAFIRAHRTHTANLFRAPLKDNPHFFYPFYLLDDKGTISEEKVLEKNLWKAIATVPTKARFEGFQLAVVGRFASRWRQLLFKIIKLILIMRYVPAALRKMARFPIPKPGKHNEYRPISLCHDMYCYIMGVVTSYSSAAIEKTGLLHNGLTAYQKGKGCANLVTTELSFREDCLESYVPSVQIDEDEEKFFDRIPVEILLAAMRVNGFPDQGYIEIKASAMETKTVEIITAKGVTYARFICGLEQGNPDSPTISNLVIKFKHDVWGHISKEIKTILERNECENQENYKFNSVDNKDGQVYLCKIGYSDDNSKFISIKNENDLLELVKYFTQLSGDISMVTKIGRKSSKCEIQFFNISAELAVKMEKVWSTAWSFVDDSPIEEEIPFKIHMKPSELEKFFRITDLFNLEEEDQLRWTAIIGAPAHRHLGLASTLGADTSTAWRKTIQKMKEKLVNLNIYKMKSQAQRKCFNMLVGTIPSFVPVQMNFPSRELMDFDKYAASFCLKSNGLSASDSKIRMFLPETMGGLGLVSTMEIDIISVAREFEIISNNITLDSRAFRTRITALENYPSETLFVNKNHAREAIMKLARYGIYLRNSDEEEVNEILAEIEKTSKKFLPFNHENYKDNCTIGIGLGKDRNLHLMYGGPMHSIIKALQVNNWKTSEGIALAAKPYRISISKILSIRSNSMGKSIRNTAQFFNHWEWRNTFFTKVQCIPKDSKEWSFRNFLPNEVDQQAGSNKDFIEECTKESRILWEHHVRIMHNEKSLLFNQYTWEGRFLNVLMNSKSPIIIATDGSHKEKENHRSTSSSFVICILDIRKDECITSQQWVQRPVIPVLARISMLPQNFGSCGTDIAHGEATALLMAEMALESMPRVTITDSKAIRETFLKMRDLKSKTNDRSYIRSIAGGLGKFTCGMMRDLLFQHKPQQPFQHRSRAMETLSQYLEKRNMEFLKIARTWIHSLGVGKERDNEIEGWEEEYFDENTIKPLLKVNSHQLEESGTRIKTSPRYRKLIPCLSVLNANHFADCCAEYGRKFENLKYHLNRPHPYLRFFFSCGGENIDRNISDFCHEQFDLLKVRKLRLKETQGLLWRLRQHTTTSWNFLNLHKGWLRMLLGLSSTHSRRVYKSQIYRECSKAKYISNFQDHPKICEEVQNVSVNKAIKCLTGCLWCNDKTPNSNKGNRNHAMLMCKQKQISDFRRKATNLIESKLKLFYLELKRATNSDNAIKYIEQVEMLFLGLQNQNLGRLQPIRREFNTRYISCEMILRREGMSSMKEALESTKFNFLCEVHGLLPNLNSIEVKDEQIGVADCVWLGLIPIIIDESMQRACESVSEFILHKESSQTIEEDLKESWKEIKTLTMGRAIGIHRIICSTGKRLEKEWRKTFKIDINSFQKLKCDSKLITPSSIEKRKLNQPDKEEETVRKKQKLSPSQSNTADFKTCTGITCHSKHKSWCPLNKFEQNKVKASLKQCQRCGRHMTAIRQCTVIVHNMIKSQFPTAIQNLYEYIKANQNSMQHNYKKLMRLINDCLNSTFKFTATMENTNRVPDRFKLIGNMLGIAFQKASLNFLHHNQEMLQRAMLILQSIQDCKISDFNLNRKVEIKIKRLTSIHETKTCKTPKGINGAEDIQQSHNNNYNVDKNETLSQPSSSSSHAKSNSPSTTDFCSRTGKINTVDTHPHTKLVHALNTDLKKRKKVELAKFALNIIRPSVCLSGDGMMKAIEILRSYKTPNLFIASAEASNQITAWSLTQTWTQFAKIFGSRDLYDNKPNGIYMIPMYSGGTGMGHWYLYVVHKIRRRFMKAWCLDSMGKGNIRNNMTQKISQAFAPGRATLQWETCECRHQEELECGPRTVLAMKIIKEGIERNIPVEDCVKKATLWQHPYQAHSPAMVREDIAYFINEFNPSMITPPLRFRRRNISNGNNNSRANTFGRDIKCIEIDLSS